MCHWFFVMLYLAGDHVVPSGRSLLHYPFVRQSRQREYCVLKTCYMICTSSNQWGCGASLGGAQSNVFNPTLRLFSHTCLHISRTRLHTTSYDDQTTKLHMSKLSTKNIPTSQLTTNSPSNLSTNDNTNLVQPCWEGQWNTSLGICKVCTSCWEGWLQGTIDQHISSWESANGYWHWHCVPCNRSGRLASLSRFSRA